ncbi:MAG: hypothetical protein KGI33_07530 [Thaumarchaeota archaeon]|nr:hypothetical protein [Nitrososphaerota archaeon]
MKILIAGLVMLLIGFVGWTISLPSISKTILYLNQGCKNGTQAHVLQSVGLNCTIVADITYIIYALLAVGMILTLTGTLMKRPNTSVKNIG